LISADALRLAGLLLGLELLREDRKDVERPALVLSSISSGGSSSKRWPTAHVTTYVSLSK
jgi:hypothetical protein